jgi:probable rRNA maturation factor
MGSIHFFNEDITYSVLKPRNTTSWIKSVIKKEKATLSEINYIFCSDKYLLTLNQQFLDHNTLTDIITFNTSEQKGVLSADIYISVDRVKENAEKFNVLFQDEIHRVMIHGVLHLLGFKDKKPAEKALMRKKEEACLSLRK